MGRVGNYMHRWIWYKCNRKNHPADTHKICLYIYIYIFTHHLGGGGEEERDVDRHKQNSFLWIFVFFHVNGRDSRGRHERRLRQESKTKHEMANSTILFFFFFFFFFLFHLIIKKQNKKDINRDRTHARNKIRDSSVQGQKSREKEEIGRKE